MCSTDHRSSDVPPASSSPVANAFDPAFLARLAERDEPAAAEEADWAGPWRLEYLLEGGLGLFRAGESPERGQLPFAAFQEEPAARLVMAMVTARREAAYRLSPLPEGRGYAVQSRAAWGEPVGWLEVFDEELIAGLSWADALMRSPQALALFLESCGKVVLERAGAILEERVLTAAR